jgi:hypothetical protein
MVEFLIDEELLVIEAGHDMSLPHSVVAAYGAAGGAGNRGVRRRINAR